MIRILRLTCLAAACAALFLACDDDDGDGGNAAARLGVGEGCAQSSDCPALPQEEGADMGPALECLPFKGGYCGLTGCQGDDDCPSGSACVTQGGANYCFLVCNEKPDCNAYRDAEDESNCSANAEFVSDRAGRKACVPPTGS
ncbi:MAG: hypothetical protein H6702_06150 [Myxococcales bacterium]|nr:hypothetical protein [Myxococcales bacterium]